MLRGGFSDARDSTRDLSPADHAVLFYDDPALIAPFCTRYLTEGIDKGQRVMSAVPADLRNAVEGLFAPEVNVLVEWRDPLEIYGDFDADRIATMYDALIGGEPREMRILAVLDRACAEGVEPSEVDRYEGLAHDVITRHGATAVCLYDTRGLPPGFLEAAARRHTLSVSDGVARRNESFEYAPV